MPKYLNKLLSFNIFLIVIISTFLIFNFLDIRVFQFSKSFPELIFFFFKNFIDPISDIFDPLNVIILTLVVLLSNMKLKKVLKNKVKLNLMIQKTGCDSKKITDSFGFYSAISLHFFWSLAVAGIGCNIIKYIMGVSRPKYFFSEGFERIDFFNIFHKANSFPSGHTQAAFTLAVLIIIHINKFHIYILTLAILMGISRIFMSMHFPSDIFFGAYLGAVVPVFLYKYYFEKKINIYKETNVTNVYDFIRLMYWRIFI